MTHHPAVLVLRPAEDDAGHEGAEDGLDADRLRQQTRGEADEQRDGECRTGRAVARPSPAEQRVHAALTGRQHPHDDREHRGDRDGELARVERAGPDGAGERAEKDPADDVVRHAGGEDHLAEVAPGQAHLRQDLRNHR